MNFLKNNIEYEYVNYGNLYYYNDGFLVQAISITFDYNLTDDIKELNKKRKTFLNYMKRKRKRCIGYTVRCGLCIQWYSVFDVSDFKRIRNMGIVLSQILKIFGWKNILK